MSQEIGARLFRLDLILFVLMKENVHLEKEVFDFCTDPPFQLFFVPPSRDTNCENFVTTLILG
jgi:hypothetical protein